MYIFRIANVVDHAKAWYQGDIIAPEVLESVTVTSPPNYPVVFSSAGHNLGVRVFYQGYIYVSLKDDNSDIPSLNYVGSPVVTDNVTIGLNSWIRTNYHNPMAMLIPESGAITESYGDSIQGSMVLPSSLYLDGSTGTCVLFCGMICSQLTVNGVTLSSLDSNGVTDGITDPESSDLNTAATMSLNNPAFFNFTINKSAKTISTWCAGAYTGSWSYIGRTQWINHKKQANDYSTQEQDQWGNYTLKKGRVGRTYSAEVVITARKDASDGQYDSSFLTTLFSVHQLLISTLGKCSAFYFNNQDIGCPWISHNTPSAGALIKLVDSDIIVGVLQSFEISEITSSKAILKLSVSSVPNMYGVYNDIEEVVDTVAPDVIDPEGEIIACERVDLYDLSTELVVANGETIEIPLAPEYVPVFKLSPFPITAQFTISSFAITNPPAVLSYSTAYQGHELVVSISGLKKGTNCLRIQPYAFTENNTYGIMAAHIFYITIT